MQGATQEQRGGDGERRRERIKRGVEHNKATLAHNSHSQSLHVCNLRLTILAYLFNAHTQLYIYMYAYVRWLYQNTTYTSPLPAHIFSPIFKGGEAVCLSYRILSKSVAIGYHNRASCDIHEIPT